MNEMHSQSSPSVPLLPFYLDGIADRLAAIRPAIDAHVTDARMARYLTAIADTPAPSTTASIMRAPVLRELLTADGVLGGGTRLMLDVNFRNTASTVMLSGTTGDDKPLWYFAHLDTISYLVKPYDGARYPLVPFCYHLIRDGCRQAQAYRFNLARSRYMIVAEGWLESDDATPFFRPTGNDTMLQSGDRVVPVTRCAPTDDGHWNGHFDNAGSVAALAVAAPILADAGIEALLAFPDEEEGPPGSGNQLMSRGGARIIDGLSPPDLAIVADMQQAADPGAASVDRDNSTELGKGAVLSEFSSLARGAVTPPHLLALARHFAQMLPDLGVRIQQSNNAYTSRSDDVSVLLKTPNILLLGFPGLDRHFDTAEPKANLGDIVDLSKALIYMALLQPVYRAMVSELGGMR